jgi:hypothetical protein
MTAPSSSATTSTAGLSRAGNDAVLVRDPELKSTGNYASNWFFVPFACVS